MGYLAQTLQHTLLSLWKDTCPTAMSPVFFMRCARQGWLGSVAIERTFRLSAGVYMIVRSLRLFPEKRSGSSREIKMGNSLRVTFDRVGLDELCTVHKQCVGNGFP
jgi:hypothetical protein